MVLLEQDGSMGPSLCFVSPRAKFDMRSLYPVCKNRKEIANCMSTTGVV